MSDASSLEAILSSAKEKEKEYDWSGAAESYKKALGSMSEQDSLRTSEIHELLGYALYRAAFQAENNDDFREGLHRSVVSYEKAKEFCQRLSEPGKTGRVLRCDAMIAYVGYWLASDVPEKKRLLNDCWKLSKEALKAFHEAGDAWEYGKTYNQLSNSVVFGFCLERDFKARGTMMRETVEHGEQAIKFLSALGKPIELARAYARTSFFLGVFDYYFLDINEKDRDYQKAQDYWMKSKEISEEIALFEQLYPIFGGHVLLWGEATDEAFGNLKKALEYSRKTRDRFIIGSALDWLVYHTFWGGVKIEDAEGGEVLYKTVLQYAEDAKHQYSTISFVTPRGDNAWVETAQAECDRSKALYETDLKKKRELSEEAIELAQNGLEKAEVSGYPETIGHANSVLASALAVQAIYLETRPEEKKRLLEEALAHRNEAAKEVEQLEPLEYWNRGVMQYLLASTKYELVDLITDSETKKSMLEEIITDMEKSLQLCFRELPLLFKKGGLVYYYPIGSSQYRMGNCLNRLYKFSHNTEHLRKAAKAFIEAAESAQKLDLRSTMAECYWKTAQTYDNLFEYLKAAESFDVASDNYKSAAEKIRQLKDFYGEHALYMQAWSEIEKARHHHARQEYGLAKEHFEKAANLHKSLRKWNYLTPNYLAWAQVEGAEDSSRKERIEEAIKGFQRADNLFKEAKNSLEAQLGKIEDADEKQMVANLAKATAIRGEYCKARISLEQARIMDKEGDHYSSSEKYGSATETFEKISQELESDQERKEVKFTINLSRAWQKMTLAEAKSSPALYLEASQLFEQAEDLSPNEKTKMLVLGHSRFCRALEAGTRYADTRDPRNARRSCATPGERFKLLHQGRLSERFRIR